MTENKCYEQEEEDDERIELPKPADDEMFQKIEIPREEVIKNEFFYSLQKNLRILKGDENVAKFIKYIVSGLRTKERNGSKFMGYPGCDHRQGRQLRI